MITGLFVFTTIMSLSFVIIGTLLLKHPPKDINSTIGYRTKKSSKNQETWDFAQRLAGIVFLITGIVNFAVCSLIILLFVNKQNVEHMFLVLAYCQIAEFFVVILITELRLKKKIENMNKNTEK